jgi:hypothetical protein
MTSRRSPDLASHGIAVVNGVMAVLRSYLLDEVGQGEAPGSLDHQPASLDPELDLGTLIETELIRKRLGKS